MSAELKTHQLQPPPNGKAMLVVWVGNRRQAVLMDEQDLKEDPSGCLRAGARLLSLWLMDSNTAWPVK